MTDELSVTREVKIAASPEEVFPYFTDRDKMLAWKAQEGEVDATVGGSYRLRIAADDVAAGEFVEIDPPRRLVYTWGWEGNDVMPPGSSTIEVVLEASGDYTIVRLTHRGLPSEKLVEQHTEGWEHYLGRLTIAAAGGDPGPDPWDQELSEGGA